MDGSPGGSQIPGAGHHAARTRSGFTPASREQLQKRLKGLETGECPFSNLPEKKAGRGGANDSRRQRWKSVTGSGPCWWANSSFWSGRWTAICDTQGFSDCGTIKCVV